MAEPRTASRRRVDLLDQEHAHGRLSPAAVTVGRAIEDALEAAMRCAGPRWAERVDGSPSAETGVLGGLEAARRARRAMQRVESFLGTADAILLRDGLGEGLSFEQMAARHGRTTRRGIASVAVRFRSGLEQLADAYAARGRVVVHTTDKYSKLAEKRREEISLFH